jgi:AcrR family transcriptional regulator
LTDLGDFAQRWQEAQDYDAARKVLRDAAHEMIRASGLHELSMRALAARVGVSPMAAYRYYPSKESLLEDVRAHVRLGFAAFLEEAASCTSDPVDKFRSLCAAYLEYGLRNAEDYRLIFGPAAPPPTASDGTRPITPAWQVLVRSLQSLPEAGAQERIIDQAHLIWATLHGLVMLHLSGRLVLGRSAEQLGEPLERFLLAALRIA